MIPVNTNFPEQIGLALSATFPELAPVESVSVLSDGLRNVVVETQAGHVFKIARNWEASAAAAKEVACLPHLAGTLPVRIPVPRWHAGRSREFPFGIIGYEKLPGTPLNDLPAGTSGSAKLAMSLGSCLAALHATPPDDRLAGNLPGPRTFWYELGREHDVILPLLRDELSATEYDTVVRWWDAFLPDARLRKYTPVVIHGDMEPGNVLVDDRGDRVIGLIDFEGLAAGDAAQDLAPLLQIGRDFALAVIDQYHAAGGILDEDFEYRVQRHWELQGFNGMRLAIHFESQPDFDRSLARLRAGPLLDEATRKETCIWPPQQR